MISYLSCNDVEILNCETGEIRASCLSLHLTLPFSVADAFAVLFTFNYFDFQSIFRVNRQEFLEIFVLATTEKAASLP